MNYDKVFECLPGSYSLVKADSPKFTLINISNYHINNLGVKKGKLLNKGFFEAYPSESKEKEDKIRSVFETVIKEHKSVKFKVRYDVLGVEKYWSLEYAPVINHGKVESIIVASVDITNMVKAGLIIDEIKK